ncbi:dihydroorotate dehydrogenase electron transfer subunit [Spirochaeta africana]|uniref:2-polyprenylphenol hydroxylase-like oxidoreductase n=1 Tax=Spirochaeta africana (strain ATCC 700263 / DSM 8902 / Z-7692) TaxID=889378 RepID=H9UIS5_SPIAZ|nr:dihydroorotate dehydrogenase electron transfer subunit [Spirochaeta africana]AFG37418.1 2-polyprenylphenol hydroxylase-like oxidoreductase [Spirochaeta africana DSM 8902]
MKHLHLTILSQRQVAEGYYEIGFSWPHDLAPPVPGQFFTVRVGSGPAPLLRRPFAFSGFTAGTAIPDAGTPDSPHTGEARCIYQKRGPATQSMTGMAVGESLDVLAPLGTAFPEHPEQGRPVLIAGGVGVGPMLYLAESWRSLQPLLIIGARSTAFLPLEALPNGIETILCTDDGSHGSQGTTIDALNTACSQNPDLSDNLGSVYACGPNPMLAASHRWALEHQRTCYVSMEQTMGCAVGACMGCVVPVHGPQPYARVCMEGPVFDSQLIDWEGLQHG